MGWEGVFVPKCMVAYSQGGRVKNFLSTQLINGPIQSLTRNYMLMTYQSHALIGTVSEVVFHAACETVIINLNHFLSGRTENVSFEFAMPCIKLVTVMIV